MREMKGLNHRQTALVVRVREHQLMWWEHLGVLCPSHLDSPTTRSWLFHDVVEAWVLRGLLVPLCDSRNLPEIPDRFCPVTEDVRDHILAVRGDLYRHRGHVRDLVIKVEGDRGLEIKVRHVESMVFSVLVSNTRVQFPESRWKPFLELSEQTRTRGIPVPRGVLHTLTGS